MKIRCRNDAPTADKIQSPIKRGEILTAFGANDCARAEPQTNPPLNQKRLIVDFSDFEHWSNRIAEEVFKGRNPEALRLVVLAKTDGFSFSRERQEHIEFSR